MVHRLALQVEACVDIMVGVFVVVFQPGIHMLEIEGALLLAPGHMGNELAERATNLWGPRQTSRPVYV